MMLSLLTALNEIHVANLNAIRLSIYYNLRHTKDSLIDQITAN